MISYAQNFEDVLLIRCFGKLSDGFYVDIGAYHPVIASVTKVFYDAGWCGINLEPGVGIDALREGRPRDINLAIAITDAEGEADFWEHTQDPGTSTLAPEVPEVVAEKAGVRILRRVPTLSLTQLLERYAGDRHIHFLKIDAEGSEDAIIAGGDWQRFRPEVLIVESTEPYTNRRTVAPWQERLRQAAYTFAYFDGINDFWVRAESESLLASFAFPVNVLDNFRVYDREADDLRGVLAEARAMAADAQLALVQTQDELAGADSAWRAAEAARATAETARTMAETARATAETERATAETARTTAEAARATAETARTAAEAALEETRHELETFRDKAAGAEQDASATREELVSVRQALADLEAWRRRLFVKLKAREAPLELRLVLPLARALRLGLPSSAAPEAPSGALGAATAVEPASGKRGLRRRLKKGLKRTKKRVRRWHLSAIRAAVVAVAAQMAKRAPKLFAKIRRDVHRKIGDAGGETAQPSPEAAVRAQVIEDALLTLALHEDRRSAGSSALPRTPGR